MYFMPIVGRSGFENYAFIEDGFTPEECKKILELGDSFREATVSADLIVKEDVRRAEVSWLDWNKDTNWIFEKLAGMTFEVNANHFGFDLSGFTERLQLTQYREQNQGFYDWHQDIGPMNMSLRKLSLVVQLTPEEEYEGGELRLFMAERNNNKPVSKKQGSVIWFPSYEAHMVTPVTKGTRHSLVTWVSGLPFR